MPVAFGRGSGTRVLAWAALACVVAALLSGFCRHLDTLGGHDWDQMETHRYFVVRSIRDFAQFPFWDPYACGGFPAWGGPESGTNVVSPFLPVYLALPLGIAVRIEVALLVVLAVVGAWFFARRYLEHPLALAFVGLVGVLNSRMALQAAVGHTWHLWYAGMPWVLGAFDRASDPASRVGWGPRLRWVALGAAVFSLMIYGGGIYPAPHTALALLGLGFYRSVAFRGGTRWRPLLLAIGMVIWGGLLAAPKLLPVRETMALFPRYTASFETIDPSWWLRMFLSSVKSIPPGRPPGLDYLWHEYGQYIGPIPLGLLLWGTLRRLHGDGPGDIELRSLRFAGWGFMVLAFGGRWSPWGLLHAVGPFRSQHAPSRFTYAGVFFLAVVAARVLERRGSDWRAAVGARWRPAFDGVVCAAFLAIAALVGREDMRCTGPWFGLEVPFVAESQGTFIQYAEVPSTLLYGDGDPTSPGGVNATPALLQHRANVGVIRCSTFNGLSQDAPKAADGRPLHLGARGVGDPLYRGEAWVEGSGHAGVRRWSPSEVDVRVEGARPGDLVALNQNWAAGWTANGQPAVRWNDVNAYRVVESTETVTFRYRPQSLALGVWLGVAGGLVGPLVWLLLRRARDPARAR